MTEERRLARLIVPGSSAGTVVVDAAGRLPAVEFTLAPGLVGDATDVRGVPAPTTW